MLIVQKQVDKFLGELKQMSDEDITAACLADGVIKTAVADFLVDFPNDGSINLVDHLKAKRVTHPHRWPYVPPEENAELAPLILAACANAPTMKARAALLAAAGPDLYAKILAQWGCSDRTLAPGRNPKANGVVTDEVKTETHKRPDKSNPWSKAGWNMTAQSRLAATLGADKAGQIAAAAGCKLGSTKPNPDFN